MKAPLIMVASILAATLLLSTVSCSLLRPAAEKGKMVGGFMPHDLLAAKQDALDSYTLAGHKAVELLESNFTKNYGTPLKLKLQTVLSVSTQVIAGTKYKMTLAIMNGKEGMKCDVIVTLLAPWEHGGHWSVHVMNEDDPCSGSKLALRSQYSVEDAARWATDHINGMSNSVFRYSLSESQVQESPAHFDTEVLHRLKLTLVPSSCRNSEDNKGKTLEECPASMRNGHGQVCQVTVAVEQESFKMKDFSCVMGEEKPRIGGDDHDYQPHERKNLIGGDDHDYQRHVKKSLIGGDDHDYQPHERKNLIGGDDHDYQPHVRKNLIGGDDHDYQPHVRKNLIGGDDHDLLPHGKLNVLVGRVKEVVRSQEKKINHIGGDNHDYMRHKPLIGGGNHDYLPHQRVPQSDNADVHHMAIGGDDHDLVPHQAIRCQQYVKDFKAFKRTYQKLYLDKDDEKQRFQVFCENMEKVKFIQSMEMGSATYGATQFADLTEEEFSKQYLGLRAGSQPSHHGQWSQAKIPEGPIPDAWDWREQGAVTPVKNQGSCGSCWAFSTTGNVEGQNFVKHRKLISLSEQELVDCDKLDEGCNGGLPSNAYEAIMKIGGIERESDYKYDGADESCKFKQSKVAVKVTGAVNISQNEDEMAAWLYKNGPISIGINAFAMQFYFGGIAHPWKMFCNPKSLDHGVLIVGYGKEGNEPYWIVKNSWGPNWGREGYYYVYRGGGVCGLNTMCTSAEVA